MLVDGGGGGYSGYRIYQMVHPNAAYSESMGGRSDGTSEAAKSHDDAAVELAGITGSLDDSWRGKAAEGARAELEMLQKISADAASSNLMPASSSMDYQGSTHTWARNTLEPMEEQPRQANVAERIFVPNSQQKYNQEWAAKNSYNIDVYNGYSDATYSNADNLSKDFPEVPESKWTDLEGPKSKVNIGGGGDDPKVGSSNYSTHSSSTSSGGDTSSSSQNGGTTSPSNSDGGGGRTEGGGTRLPDGSIRLPDGTILHPDGSKTLPDGTRVLPDGTRILPDGTKVLPDGTKILPNGTKILPDGTIVRPNGQVIPPGNTSSSGLSSGGSGSDATAGLLAGGAAGAGAGAGAAGGALGAGGFGPGGGASSGVGGLGAGKGMGAGAAGGGAAGMGKAGAMGRGGMGGMMGGAGAGRGGGGDDEKEHQDQYFIKQELDPGLHVEYDEFGEKLIDDSTGLTVVPPVIGE